MDLNLYLDVFPNDNTLTNLYMHFIYRSVQNIMVYIIWINEFLELYFLIFNHVGRFLVFIIDFHLN